MAEPARPEVRYTAFLSYSHMDAAAGGRLHRRLEGYRLPRRLVGTATARGTVPARLWPIFRDRDELPAASDLSETVREALGQSGALIVLCSPHSAGSMWVAEEIETFRRLHPDRPILAAIHEGDPPDCFPAALRAFGQDGTWHEPLATDLRRGRDGPHLGLLKLVAGVTGVGLDALVQRDAARKVRRVTAVTAVAVIAMLIMAALAWLAIEARREAERQRAEAEGQIEFMLTDLRERLRGVGRLNITRAVNQQALRYYGRQNLERLSPESLERRARILIAIGEDDLQQDNFPAALSAFREAHRTTEEQLARDPRNADRIFAHAQSEYWIGYVGYRRRDFRAARLAWYRYKNLADQLLALDPNNTRWITEAGYAEGNVCTIALEVPLDASGALSSCTVALGHFQRVRQLRHNAPGLTRDLANRHGWMVRALEANGHWRSAKVHQAHHEGLARMLLTSDPTNADYQDIWIRGQIGFAEMQIKHRERAEARRRLSAILPRLAPLVEHDPENQSWRDLLRRAQDATRQSIDGS